MEKKRIIYFDYLRVFAILAVIFIHVAAQNWYNSDIKSFEWNIFNIFALELNSQPLKSSHIRARKIL